MMMIREVWTLNTIPSPFDLPSLFVFPWPILEASSHFYLSSCFGFTLITPASIAKSSLFGLGQNIWNPIGYFSIILAYYWPNENPRKLIALKASDGDVNTKKAPSECVFLRQFDF